MPSQIDLLNDYRRRAAAIPPADWTAHRGQQGTKINHEVRADEIGISLRGQTVVVEREQR